MKIFKKDFKLKKNVLNAEGLIFILSFVAVGFFLLKFGLPCFDTGKYSWGSGDPSIETIFNNIFAPVLSFFAIVFVWLSSISQYKQNKMQSYENHFFNLMNGYNSIISSMKSRIDPNLEGKAYLRDLAENVPGNLPVTKNNQESDADYNVRLNAVFDGFYNQHSYNLSHYFRYLYNIVNYLDEEAPNDEVKMRYINIYKAHLSDFEFELIFLNSLTTRGAKFKSHIETFSLFENWFRDSEPGLFFRNVKNQTSLFCYLPPNGHHFLAKNSHPWSPVRNWLFSPAVTG